MQKLFFGMIITDPEHLRLRLKWRDYHGIINQQTPYKSHNAKDLLDGQIHIFTTWVIKFWIQPPNV